MARPRKFRVGILNVVTHPHTPEGYAQLFLKAFELKQIIPLDGDRRAYLGSCFNIGANSIDGLEGNIYRFVNIDQEQPWLNMLTGKEADPDEIENNVEIPNHLKPNFCAMRYNFFPKSHKLVFEIERRDPISNKPTRFSPSMAEKFFRRLFSENAIRKEFPDVELTIEQSSETLDEIFQIHRLRTLQIVIKRPNPNDGEIEEEIERQLEEEHVDVLEQEIKSKEDKEGLKPSQRTKVLSNIALSNGYVYGFGHDHEGNRKELKTENKPRVHEGIYRVGQTYSAAFTLLAEKVSSKMTNVTK